MHVIEGKIRSRYCCNVVRDVRRSVSQRSFIAVEIYSDTFTSINTFSIISAQDLVCKSKTLPPLQVWHIPQEPYGYSSDTAGFMGATLLLAGIVAAIFTAPLFDHVLTKHLALTVKVLVPIMAALWLSLIWASAYLTTDYSHFYLNLMCSQSGQITPRHCMLYSPLLGCAV